MENNYQNILFPYAYNILGSSEDAKDAVQEVVYKYLSAQKTNIDNEPAYLVKGVINQSINLKKRKQKLVSDQVWLPEPVATERAESQIIKEELLTYSMLVLLEKLNPKERAVFILKEAFDYSHKEIAEAFDCSTENARTLLSRARKKLADLNTNNSTSTPQSQSEFLTRYLEVIGKGNVKALEALLSQDITVTADGGGKVQVVRELTIGREAASELLQFVYHSFQAKQRVELGQLNHQPALLFFQKNQLSSCQVFDIQDGVVKHIYAVVDPEKLSTIF